MEVINVSIHPDSKKQIAGVFIPNWSDTINRVLSVMGRLSFLKYVGIDLVINENGFKIIEMNFLTSLSALQIEEGLLKDERLKRFFLG
jgi:predicted ATP-grasp superfamily ATP-dependent carboligase